MFIESVEYIQWEDNPNRWKLNGCTLGQINLFVGKNASGKTKTLNVIGNLGRLLAGEHKAFTSAHYKKVEFKKAGTSIGYSLRCENSIVDREEVTINGELRLERGGGGKGEIFFEKENKTMEFQTPENEVAAFARRDTIQHPFLNELYSWGKSIRHYYFGTDLGRNSFAVFQKTEDKKNQLLDLKETDQVVAIVKQGLTEYPGIYEERIKKDMEAIGYNITELGVHPQRNIQVQGGVPIGELWGLYIREADLTGIIEQMEMSQGMFRALSLISQIAYSELTGSDLCILVDDIGEGLDYERSVALIKQIINRVNNTTTQLIMATNDRFVMNNVPLEYWSIVHRKGNEAFIYNYRNAKKMFDSFKITGLNNFDLFSSEFYLRNSD